jgi:hypothetical protein
LAVFSSCIDALASHQFGDFLVRVVCECGACREIQQQALARLVGWKMTLKELALHKALLEVWEEVCRGD